MNERLSRAASQERTRARIVDAAMRLFLRKGFGATSLEEIGEEAGFTRGAVYSNFESKTALGITVIDALYEREVRRLRATIPDAGDRDARLDALAAWADETIGDPAWARLEIEVAASSTRDNAYRAATAARHKRQREIAADAFAELFGDTLDMDADVLATALLGLVIGIGTQRAADPSVRGSALADFLRAVAVAPEPANA
jgi:AcrR family transcriptional regulator